jgi:hypothetical protein
MNKRLKSSLSLAIAAAMMTSPTAFAYDQTDAIEDCQDKLFDDSQYARYSSPHGATAQETGRNSYKVSGLVKDRDKKDHRFNCRIDHREVVSWNVSPEQISDSDKKTAAAIGAGVLGLAILAAAVSGDKDHDNKRSAYEKGESSPFDDMGYLKRECTDEVRRHLERDHGSVRDLELTHPHLNDRTLTGNGRVSFERGGRQDLSFTCDFDRRGQVQDGHYSYADGGGDDDDRSSTSGGGGSVDVSDLVGAKAAGVQSDLESRGFRNVDSFESGNNAKGTIWWNGRTRQCLQMITADGRADSITDIQTHARCR